MNDGSDALVWWILVPLFAAVGLYLIWYSRRRRKMLEAFAATHGLRLMPEREGELQETLDACFSLKIDGLVRTFDQLSSVLVGGSIWVFRAVELLDLNPHARSPSTHFARIAALFEVSPDQDEFFLLDKSMQARQRLPGSPTPGSDVAGIVKRITASCNARHALSVTLARGHGLIYFEPLVTGGETLNDVDALYCIATSMREDLAGNA